MIDKTQITVVRTAIRSALEIQSVVGGALFMVSQRLLEVALDTGFIGVSCFDGILRNINE